MCEITIKMVRNLKDIKLLVVEKVLFTEKKS